MAKLLFLISVLVFVDLSFANPIAIPQASENETAVHRLIGGDRVRDRHRFVSDMILHDDDLDDQDVASGEPIPVSRTYNPPKLWPNGFVYYEISPDAYHKRMEIDKAMRQIQNQARCIVFIPRTDEDNYVYIDLGEGCNSYVGMVGGKQELNMDSCQTTGDLIHELMHVLGFYHEHQRPDRDRYLFLFEENILPEKKDNFRKVSPLRYRLTNAEFDFGSIMIYGNRAFSRNGQPTMEPRDWTSTQLANPETKTKLSMLDEYALNMFYCF